MEVKAMIIELPKEFTFFNEIGEEVAYIDGRGILKLKSVAAFRKVMFEIAYEMKGRNRCCYCGKTVESNRMTIDHMYPQDFGGPTITNNLLPCCQKCNSEKGNLTTGQYKKYLLAKEQGRSKEYIRDLKLYLMYVRKWELFEIPKEWISRKEITEIFVKIDLNDDYKGKNYKHVKDFYEEYGHLQKPVIVDKKNFLLDGFIILMYAKNKKIRKIPVIKLENVEVIT